MNIEANGDGLRMKFGVKLPTPPNYLTVDGPFVLPGTPGVAQELPKVDVADLSEDAITVIGKAWTQQLLDHAHSRALARIGKPTPR